jgi:hypothetical protein
VVVVVVAAVVGVALVEERSFLQRIDLFSVWTMS